MIFPSVEGRLQMPTTGVDAHRLKKIAEASVKLPADFEPHRRLKRTHIGARLAQLEGEGRIDWATAETMAVGSLV